MPEVLWKLIFLNNHTFQFTWKAGHSLVNHFAFPVTWEGRVMRNALASVAVLQYFTWVWPAEVELPFSYRGISPEKQVQASGKNLIQLLANLTMKKNTLVLDISKALNSDISTAIIRSRLHFEKILCVCISRACFLSICSCQCCKQQHLFHSSFQQSQLQVWWSCERYHSLSILCLKLWV